MNLCFFLCVFVSLKLNLSICSVGEKPEPTVSSREKRTSVHNLRGSRSLEKGDDLPSSW